MTAQRIKFYEMLIYLSKVCSGMKNATKIRSDLYIMQHGQRVFKSLLLCVKSGKPEAIDSTPAVDRESDRWCRHYTCESVLCAAL